MSLERRTLRGWFEYLDDAKREFTLAEFMALMVMNQREYARLALDDVHEMRQATEHVEGMLGAIDEMCSRIDAEYKADGAVRAALDAQRDERRALAGEAVGRERNGAD